MRNAGDRAPGELEYLLAGGVPVGRDNGEVDRPLELGKERVDVEHVLVVGEDGELDGFARFVELRHMQA